MPETIAHLIPYHVDARVTETPSRLVASINFRKPLGHPQDALAILTTLLPRERVADFDWLAAGVEDGGEGRRRTHVYYLRVPKKVVAECSTTLNQTAPGLGGLS